MMPTFSSRAVQYCTLGSEFDVLSTTGQPDTIPILALPRNSGGPPSGLGKVGDKPGTIKEASAKEPCAARH